MARRLKRFSDIKRGFKDEYDLSSKALGKGAFGEVFEATQKGKSNKVAVKVISKATPGLDDSLNHELTILSMVKGCKFLLQFMGAYQDARYYYIVTELLPNGELFRQLEKRNWLYSEKDACIVLRSILQGVQELHERKILHRDLKLENVLCGEGFDKDQSKIRIIDFGCSIVLDRNEYSEGFMGSELYAAPEIFCHLPFSFPADMWAIGVLAYLLLAGEPPFRPEDGSVACQVAACNVKFPPDIWKDMPKAQNFCLQLLTPKPEHRLTVADALKHAFIRQAEEEETLISSGGSSTWAPPITPRAKMSSYVASNPAPQTLVSPRVSAIKYSRPVMLQRAPSVTRTLRHNVISSSAVQSGGGDSVPPLNFAFKNSEGAQLQSKAQALELQLLGQIQKSDLQSYYEAKIAFLEAQKAKFVTSSR